MTSTSAPFANSVRASEGPVFESEDDDAARRIEAVGIRLVLAVGRAPLREVEMRVLDRSHLDVGVLIDEAGSNVMTAEDIGHQSAIGRFFPSAQRISAFGVR